MNCITINQGQYNNNFNNHQNAFPQSQQRQGYFLPQSYQNNQICYSSQSQYQQNPFMTSLEKKLTNNEIFEDISEELEQLNVFGNLNESLDLMEIEYFNKAKKQKESLSNVDICNESSYSKSTCDSNTAIVQNTNSTPLNIRKFSLLGGQGVHIFFTDQSDDLIETEEIFLFDGEEVLICTHYSHFQKSAPSIRMIIIKPNMQIFVRRALSDFNDIETTIPFPLKYYQPSSLHFTAMSEEEYEQ